MTKDLTGGSPLKVILFFTLPLVLGNLFQQFYALADTIIVGRFCGVSALASVGSTGSINYLILGFVIGICNGFAIPIAQLFGARDYSDLRRHVANAAWLCIAFSVVLTITTVTLTRPLLVLMQTPEDILDGAVIYIGWIFASIPFIFLYNMVASIMRALGDSKTPLYFLILTSALNIGLDLLFIVPFKMGILGAALATDISQAISGVVSFGFLCRKFEVLHMQKGELAFSKRACIRLMGIGVPMGLQCSITAIGSVIMQWAVNVLGSTAVAAVTAASKTMNLLTVPLESVGTAMATYSGQNLGAAPDGPRAQRRYQRTADRHRLQHCFGSYPAFCRCSRHVPLPRHDHRGGDRRHGARVPLLEQRVFRAAGCADRLALQHPGPGLLHAGHDGRRGRDDRPYRRGHRAGADAGLLWRRAGEPRRLDRGLHLPVPGLPLDLPQVGQPPAGRPPAHAKSQPRPRTGLIKHSAAPPRDGCFAYSCIFFHTYCRNPANGV